MIRQFSSVPRGLFNCPVWTVEVGDRAWRMICMVSKWDTTLRTQWVSETQYWERNRKWALWAPWKLEKEYFVRLQSEIICAVFKVLNNQCMPFMHAETRTLVYAALTREMLFSAFSRFLRTGGKTCWTWKHSLLRPSLERNYDCAEDLGYVRKEARYLVRQLHSRVPRHWDAEGTVSV